MSKYTVIGQVSNLKTKLDKLYLNSTFRHEDFLSFLNQRDRLERDLWTVEVPLVGGRTSEATQKSTSSAPGLNLADVRSQVNLLTMSVRYDTKYKRM